MKNLNKIWRNLIASSKIYNIHIANNVTWSSSKQLSSFTFKGAVNRRLDKFNNYEHKLNAQRFNADLTTHYDES